MEIDGVNLVHLAVSGDHSPLARLQIGEVHPSCDFRRKFTIVFERKCRINVVQYRAVDKEKIDSATYRVNDWHAGTDGFLVGIDQIEIQNITGRIVVDEQSVVIYRILEATRGSGQEQ